MLWYLCYSTLIQGSKYSNSIVPHSTVHDILHISAGEKTLLCDIHVIVLHGIQVEGVIKAQLDRNGV